jgi:hypothetical protein
MTIRLDEQGGGVAVATEELAGWPALEWAELVERFGADRARLRQDFEQRWLGVQFPGARLRELEIDVPEAAGAPRDGPGPVFFLQRAPRGPTAGHRGAAPTRCASRRPSSARSRAPLRGRTAARDGADAGFDVPTRDDRHRELPRARADRRGQPAQGRW